MDVVTLQLAKKYAADTMAGAGAIKGDKGDKGDTGPSGPAGDNGFSPTFAVTDIPGGHRVTITDADGTKSFDVMDGEGGAGGEIVTSDQNLIITKNEGTKQQEIRTNHKEFDLNRLFLRNENGGTSGNITGSGSGEVTVDSVTGSGYGSQLIIKQNEAQFAHFVTGETSALPVRGIATPTQDNDAANKAYVDAVAAGPNGGEMVYLRVTNRFQTSGVSPISCVVPAYIDKETTSDGERLRLHILAPTILAVTPATQFYRLYVSIMGNKYRFKSVWNENGNNRVTALVNSEGSGTLLSCYNLNAEILTEDESDWTTGGKAGNIRIVVGVVYEGCGGTTINYLYGNCVILPSFESEVELAT